MRSRLPGVLQWPFVWPPCVLGLVACLLCSSGLSVADEPGPQGEFFANLKKLCGQQFEGVTEFPENADHPMVGKKLILAVASCTDAEIRLPLQVGEDKSRTWILTLSEK